MKFRDVIKVENIMLMIIGFLLFVSVLFGVKWNTNNMGLLVVSIVIIQLSFIVFLLGERK